ncbi:hypothetical protein HZA41_03470, partial [Candidatus Peregrinibacteria bacterium]|nr:hypothetical protein [Candidatus Peregrinibacteria bacterium]
IIGVKLGITRRGIPLILGKQKKRQKNLIFEQLHHCGVQIFDVEKHFSIFGLTMTEKGIFFEYCSHVFFLRLHGEAAVWNALTALLTAEHLLKKCDPVGVEMVFGNMSLPGHFEIRSLPNGGKLILDVLHTPESARNFRQTLEQVFPNRSYVFIAAFLQDKNVPAILKQLVRPRDSIFFPKISHPRFASNHYKTGDLSKIFQEIAQSDCQQKIFCLIGSHYLLGEAKKLNLLP